MGIRTTKSRLGGQRTTHFFVSSLRVKTTEPLALNFRVPPQPTLFTTWSLPRQVGGKTKTPNIPITYRTNTYGITYTTLIFLFKGAKHTTKYIYFKFRRFRQRLGPCTQGIFVRIYAGSITARKFLRAAEIFTVGLAIFKDTFDDQQCARCN